MSRSIVTALFFAVAISIAPDARATEDTCSQPCPEGQVTTSFLDGQQVNCVCMAPGPGMTDDTNINYGGTGDEAEANTQN